MIFVTPKRPHENENPGFSNLSSEVWIGFDYQACAVGRMLGVITGSHTSRIDGSVKNQKNKESAQSNNPCDLCQFGLSCSRNNNFEITASIRCSISETFIPLPTAMIVRPGMWNITFTAFILGKSVLIKFSQRDLSPKSRTSKILLDLSPQLC